MMNDDVQYVVPTEGQTVIIRNSDKRTNVVLDPSTTLNVLTFQMPVPTRAIFVNIYSSNTIAEIAFTGATFRHITPKKIGKEGIISFFFLPSTSTWYFVSAGNQDPDTNVRLKTYNIISNASSIVDDDLIGATIPMMFIDGTMMTTGIVFNATTGTITMDVTAGSAIIVIYRK